MTQTTGNEVAARVFQFLANIEDPVPVAQFISLELTGDPVGDAPLAEVARLFLVHLKSDGIAATDDLSLPDAKIYGLTPYGEKVYQDFQNTVAG